MALQEINLGGRDYIARETLSVTDTATGLTVATFATATHALITVETAQIRFTVDGTTATTAIGHIRDPGDSIELNSTHELSKFSAIRTGGVSASLQCSYGK